MVNNDQKGFKKKLKLSENITKVYKEYTVIMSNFYLNYNHYKP